MSSKKIIRVWDYLDEYRLDKNAILKAVDSVFSSGQLILGQSVKNFEFKFAKYCGVNFGIGLDNATNAIAIALKTLNIQSEDEVITVANTAVPTVSAIVQAGGKPVFVDVIYKTGLMDCDQIIKKITSKTKFIIPVHLYGQCADMDKIIEIAKAHQLSVIEDCSQAHGATYKSRKAGSMGDIGIFSFYPTKILGGYGDGGIAITNNEKYADRLKRLRFYGMDEAYFAVEHGFNSRLDEVHAKILNLKLKSINKYITKRRAIAKFYDKALIKSNYELPYTEEYNLHSYYLYVIKSNNRDKILKKLNQENIKLNISYPYPIHLMDAYKYLGYKIGDLPITEVLAKKIFSLPMYPSLNQRDQLRVIKNLLALN